jgi:hypothetical protein
MPLSEWRVTRPETASPSSTVEIRMNYVAGPMYSDGDTNRNYANLLE